MDFDVFLKGDGWENPYSYARQRSDGCRLVELIQGITDLLNALNSSEIKILKESDFLRIAEMYDRSWWQFVDCRYSNFSDIKSEIRLVLWDCDQHATTLKFFNSQWVADSNEELMDNVLDDPEDPSVPETNVDLGIGEDLTDEDQEYAALAERKGGGYNDLDVLQPSEIEDEAMEDIEDPDFSIESLAYHLREEGYRAKIEDEFILSASQGYAWNLVVFSIEDADFLLFRCNF